MSGGYRQKPHQADSATSATAANQPQSSAPHEDAHLLKTDEGTQFSRSQSQTRQIIQTDNADDAGVAKQSPGQIEPHHPAQASLKTKIVRQYELIERIKAYDPDCDEDMLNRAYVYSMVAHGGQTRKNGDPYFTHPIAVAMILTELKADPLTIATALLHDTVEDTDATIEDIEKKFGRKIAEMVDGVTKISKLELQSRDTAQAENFRKFVLAMAQDVRVLLVKLADRLHNMRTLHFVTDEEKRKKTALETMEIYVPLAGRVGVQKFREELEDLCFLYLNPDGYNTIADNLKRLGDDAVRAVVGFAQDLRTRLEANKISAEVTSREKRPFSIWRKMQRKGAAFEELADIFAFRVIVNTVEDCYRALGIIHSTFPMIHGEFDDYISTPKPNNYRSIHTAILASVSEGNHKQRVEIQIRTRAMHESAERGIAAHWKYKDATNGKRNERSIELVHGSDYDPYEWMRTAVEMLQHGEDANSFLEHAKLELFQDQVFCFTPGGRVISLPQGATSLDFAYGVHTALGDSCVGARVNGVTRPLRTVLKNGDVIEVLTSTNAPVPDEWRSLAVSGKTKAAITRRIKKLQKDEQIKLGRKLVESELSAHALPHTDHAIEEALLRLGMTSIDAVYEAVGRLDLTVKKVREAAYPGAGEGINQTSLDGSQTKFTGKRRPIPIEGLKRGVTVILSSCCSPLPGERIVGLPGKNHGIMVHRIDCAAIEETSIPEEEWLDLRWRDEQTTSFIARISVLLNNRIGALAHVASTLARYGTDIVNVSIRKREEKFSEMVVDVEVADAKHLANVLTALRASEHVLTAERRQDIAIETAEEATGGDTFI